MDYPEAWIDYLIYFHVDQDFFECHEVLEEHWKNEGMKGNLWPGLIQIAVALYHQRRGNMNGAKRMITSGIQKLYTEKKALLNLGIELDPFFHIIEERKLDIQQQKEFQPISLPITSELLEVCLLKTAKTEEDWGNHGNPDENIIHKHRLRDRTSVIEEREKQKLHKKRFT
ncbi:DUF309 domain-containing protein [Fictibacillus phosphorivorans]|uniref:DUF309 domain-containing protein n=1 Tax=Fictibacillus phosphorivorans TaxID=1221500 RepID=UPI00203F37DF|nr:DUF309 domain-containing protein [Fictibacillus phosphorivorans]MCM3719700.1 DUF309 domain-containing protein [Fictibacillus phosphorivorans]MCM3777391.1 DUF309 domain-containing protein [Fictibacillus phosphorivorans]